MDKYLEIWKYRLPENIKIIIPPQFLGITSYNFSGVVIFEAKRDSDICSFLEEYKSAGFKISLSPIWDNTEISKKLEEYREGKRKAEMEWEKTLVKKLNIDTTSSVEILPLIDMKTDLQGMDIESGVSYLVRTDNMTILFDVGLNKEGRHPSPLLNNMEKLGVSLKEIDAIVISHNHGDHVGGSKWAKNKTFSLSGAQIKLGDIKVYTPITMSYPRLDPNYSYDPIQIGKGVATIGVISNQLFFLGRTPEQALAVNVENKGILLIIGCGHQTLPKILHRTKALFNEPLYGLVGGLHFPVNGGPITFYGYQPHKIFGTGKEPWNPITEIDLRENITLLQQFNPKLLALSPHDSSNKTMEILQTSFPTVFREIKVGEAIKI